MCCNTHKQLTEIEKNLATVHLPPLILLGLVLLPKPSTASHEMLAAATAANYNLCVVAQLALRFCALAASLCAHILRQC